MSPLGLQDLPTRTEPDPDFTRERARQELISLAEYRETLVGDEVDYFDFEVHDKVIVLGRRAGLEMAPNKGRERPTDQLEDWEDNDTDEAF